MFPQTELSPQALPVLSLKTTVTEAPRLARNLVGTHGGSARVLCVNGVVHYYPPPELESLPDSARYGLAERCTAEGGHLSGLWAKDAPCGSQETAWAKELQLAWNQL
jgi:hypothetical protein